VRVTFRCDFLKVSNRVVFMLQGKVWEEGDSKSLLSDPQTDELKQFIGAVL